jgi:acyl-CoA thioesterase
LVHPYLQNDKFANYLNIELLEAVDGRATARLEIQEHHLNSHGTVHGGVVFSLADAVLAAASNSHGVVAVAINANISYVKAVSSGVITAIAEEVSLNPVLATYDVKVTADNNDLIATFKGMVYRKRQRFDS